MAETADIIADAVRAERAGNLEQALQGYRAVVELAPDPDTRARAYTHIADVHRVRCDWAGAIEAARTAQDVAESTTPPLAERLAEALNAEANVLLCLGDYIGAARLYELVAARSSDDRVRGIAMQNLGSVYAQNAQPVAAERAFAESRELFQRAHYRRGEAIALNNLGRLAFDTGDCARSRALLDEALIIAREEEDLDLAALVSVNFAAALCKDGLLDRAQDLAMAALGYYTACDNRWREIECLRLIGDINARADDRANAMRCYQLAMSLAEQIGAPPEIALTRDRIEALSASAPAS